MDWHIFSNLLNPAILFFFMGFLAVFIKSDLEIPQSVSKFLSIYLLMSIGFHGGAELHKNGLNSEALLSLGACLLMAVLIPSYVFFFLRKQLSIDTSALVAATYGSVSAVTFITAIAFLKDKGVPFGGFMVASMALMEFPAILVGIILANVFSSNQDEEKDKSSIYRILWETFTNSSVYLILGSLVAGIVSNPTEAQALKPFTEELFKGMLCIFMLDIGLLAAKRVGALTKFTPFLIAFAIVIPCLNAFAGIFLAYALKLSAGNAFIFSVLCASASYVAVPAAMRTALPASDLSISIPLALTITFPFNIIVGLPSYYFLIRQFWG